MGASEVNETTVSVYMPAQATPPYPAPSTVGACAIYYPEGGTTAWLSANGGAYVPIQTGSGSTTVTLNAAYANGPAGNTILMTDALAPITLSSGITTGGIFKITTTTAPAAVTGSITGIAIDMSSLGTAATPATLDMPAITVVGAYSSVAKSSSRGLVYLVSGYRNATALRVSCRNKQAAAGSIVAIGWDATNYEGAAANSVLTGQTHVVTIDGVTNVTPGAVEFIGLRVLVPASTSGNTTGITVSSAQTQGVIHSVVGTGAVGASGITGLRVNMSANTTAAILRGLRVDTPTTTATTSVIGVYVSYQQRGGTLISCSSPGGVTLDQPIIGLDMNMSSGVTAGAIQVTGASVTMPASTSASTRGYYITSLQKAGALFYGSFSGATTTSDTLYGTYTDLVTNLTYGAQVYANYLTMRGAQATIGGIGYRLDIGGTDGPSFRGLDFENNAAYTATRSGTNSNGAAFIFLYNHPSISGAAQTLTMNDRVITIDHGPSASGGASLVDNTYLVDITASPGSGTNSIRVFNVTMGSGNSGSGSRMFYGTSAQTAGMLFDIVSTGTYGGAVRGVSIDMSSAAPGAQAVTGVQVSIPASTSASTSIFSGTSTQTAGSLAAFTGTGTPSAQMTGLTVNMSGMPSTAQEILGLNVLTPTSSSTGTSAFVGTLKHTAGYGAYWYWLSAVTFTGTVTGLDVNLDNGNNASTFRQRGVFVSTTTGTSSASTGVEVFARQRAGALFVGSFNGSGGNVTLSGAMTGLSLDLSTNVTANSQVITGIAVTLPSGASSSSRGVTITVNTNTAHQMQFVSTTDGSAFHLLGPAAGQFRIGAGTPGATANTTAGREVAVVGGNAVAGVSVDGAAAGGSLYFTAGNAARRNSGNANGGGIELNGGTGIGTGVAGGVLVGSVTPTFLEMYEMTAPAVAATNGVRLFAVDNGSGKTVLKAQFQSGAAQTIATEP